MFLDVVYNHFGPEGNYLRAFAEPFFTERHHTPWGAAINVDAHHAEVVREFFVQNSLYWLREYRFDGIAATTPCTRSATTRRAPFSTSSPRACAPAWKPAARSTSCSKTTRTKRAGSTATTRSGTTTRTTRSTCCLTGEADGYYRDYAREPARLLARALAEGFAYQGEPSAHRGGASRGEPSAALPSTAFVDYLQNHDQIGNRAYGERLGALAPDDAVRAATAVLLLAPAIPLLFMGEEWCGVDAVLCSSPTSAASSRAP